MELIFQEKSKITQIHWKMEKKKRKKEKKIVYDNTHLDKSTKMPLSPQWIDEKAPKPVTLPLFPCQSAAFTFSMNFE